MLQGLGKNSLTCANSWARISSGIGPVGIDGVEAAIALAIAVNWVSCFVNCSRKLHNSNSASFFTFKVSAFVWSKRFCRSQFSVSVF